MTPNSKIENNNGKSKPDILFLIEKDELSEDKLCLLYNIIHSLALDLDNLLYSHDVLELSL